MAYKRLASLDLDPNLMSHVNRQGLKTVKDVLDLPLPELMRQLCLSAPQARALQDQLCAFCRPKPCTIWDLLEEESKGCLSLGDASLDSILGGGLHQSSITEFAGPAGVGKTQWCLEETVRCLLSSPQPKPVIYIDTEAAFIPSRVVEMLKERLPDERQNTIAHLLSLVIVHQPTTISSLEKILQQLFVSAAESRAAVVVVDSIASLARKEFPAHRPCGRSLAWKRVLAMAGWVAKLKALASDLKLSVIVTNQVTSRRVACELPPEEDVEEPSDAVPYEQFVTPALGNTWTHFVNTRLLLQYADESDASKRQLLIAKSPVAPFAAFNYTITAAGVQVEGIGCYSYTGCDPGLQRLNVRPGSLI